MSRSSIKSQYNKQKRNTDFAWEILKNTNRKKQKIIINLMGKMADSTISDMPTAVHNFTASVQTYRQKYLKYLFNV